VDPTSGLDDMENRKFFALPELELRPLCRPTRSQSLYQLCYPGSLMLPVIHTNIYGTVLAHSVCQRTTVWMSLYRFSLEAPDLSLLHIVQTGGHDPSPTSNTDVNNNGVIPLFRNTSSWNDAKLIEHKNSFIYTSVHLPRYLHICLTSPTVHSYALANETYACVLIGIRMTTSRIVETVTHEYRALKLCSSDKMSD
jgi:hypothetical protein